MKKVFLTRDDFPSSAIELLKEKFQIVTCGHIARASEKIRTLDNIKGVHAIFCTDSDVINKNILNAAGAQLQVVSTASLDFDHIDIEECKKRKIIVTNVPDVDIAHIVEFAIGLLISVGRRIVEASTAVIQRKTLFNWKMNLFQGRGLKDSNVGIVGMGKIGLEIIKRLAPFDIKNIYYNNGINRNEQAEQLGAVYSPFEHLLTNSQFVIANCDHTTELFNLKAFDMMDENAVFINIGRAEVVQYDDLFVALKRKKIKGAALAIMQSQLLQKYSELLFLRNIVICPPIINTDTIITIDKANFNARNIISILEEGKALTSVY